MALNIIRAGATQTRTLPDGVKRSIMAYDSDVTLSFMRSEKNESVNSFHAHPHRQLVYILCGSGVFCVDNESELVKAGDCVSIPSDAVHSFTRIDEYTEWLEFFAPGRDDLAGEFKQA